jgi:hypothetical protein
VYYDTHTHTHTHTHTEQSSIERDVQKNFSAYENVPNGKLDWKINRDIKWVTTVHNELFDGAWKFNELHEKSFNIEFGRTLKIT